MTEREKVAHLLRRFGLGASQSELDRLEPLGVDRAFESLLDFEKTPTDFPLTPWNFAFNKDGKAQLDPTRFGLYWTFRLLWTNRPLEEKLTLFWHNHFAVSGAKVEFGPMMQQHLDMLRSHAAGNFRTLLGAVTEDPAMLRWLDNDLSLKGKPNENYARELMELFTMGVGNYTETDVKEVARALTGWSLRPMINRDGRRIPVEDQIREILKNDWPFVAASYTPQLHDDGYKSILGEKARFDTEQVLDLLAHRKETARFIVTKLWSFFAYRDPEPKVVESLMKVYFDAKLEIKPILRAIYKSKEFWSDKCIHGQIKSPVDFTVGAVRQVDIRKIIETLKPSPATIFSPAPDQIMSACGTIYNAIRKQGMWLLYPPDVSGWSWGPGWISAGAMIERMQFINAIVNPRRGSASLLGAVRAKVAVSGVQNEGALVDCVAGIFDVKVSAAQRTAIAESVRAGGGMEALKSDRTAPVLLSSVVRTLFAAPEAQFC